MNASLHLVLSLLLSKRVLPVGKECEMCSSLLYLYKKTIKKTAQLDSFQRKLDSNKRLQT